jgi:polyphosphate kinase
MPKRLFNRDLSWLSFNHRVLQEAADVRVPLYERLKFLAIFSSNLDEFYRIRVAEWKRLNTLRLRTKKVLRENPKLVLKKINTTVRKHLAEFEEIWQDIVRELDKRHICILTEQQLDSGQKEFVRNYFHEKVEPLLRPVFTDMEKTAPILDEKSLYMAIRLGKKGKGNVWKYRYVLTEIPSRKLSRFVVLPDQHDTHFVMIMGDILRFGLPEYFTEYDTVECYSIKLTRDAELMLEDEFSGSLLKKIKKSLSVRQKGAPTRLLYDRQMPEDLLKHLRKIYSISKLDLQPGGRYLNFSDLMDFPVFERENIYDVAQPALPVKELDHANSMFDALTKRDFLLHFPYHSYDYVIRLVQEAARDSKVRAIKITLYRAASQSKIIQALLDALENGKQVTAFMELKARFDEESNIQYAKELEAAGARVLYSFPILKVHAKMLLIERIEDDKLRRYSYLSTGNFNEKTARLYSDTSLLTRDKYLGREVAAVFDILNDTRIKREFSQLLVAPDHMRHDLYSMIDQEIKYALKGKEAWIFLKLNSLQDNGIIEKLYEASQDGVKIRLIIRGICCLIPGVEGQSENIRVISVVDRYLEHSRVLMFGNAGQPKVYLSSGDWMERNLSRRYEVGFPVNDPALKEELIEMMKIQWKDNVKARIINKIQNNAYRKSRALEKHRAQSDLYHYLRLKLLHKG